MTILQYYLCSENNIHIKLKEKTIEIYDQILHSDNPTHLRQ